MAEFQYQFKAVDDQNKISGSKIINIIDGFPADYSEQTGGISVIGNDSAGGPY